MSYKVCLFDEILFILKSFIRLTLISQTTIFPRILFFWNPHKIYT